MSDDVLNSWKEIAAYTHRGIRTLQRWEQDLEFPIHRPQGRGHSPVTAFKSEIDLWFRMSHCEPDGKPGKHRYFELHRSLLNNLKILQTRTARLLESRRALREEMVRALDLTSQLAAGRQYTREQGIGNREQESETPGQGPQATGQSETETPNPKSVQQALTA